jgi:hypothetical protein
MPSRGAPLVDLRYTSLSLLRTAETTETQMRRYALIDFGLTAGTGSVPAQQPAEARPQKRQLVSGCLGGLVGGSGREDPRSRRRR